MSARNASTPGGPTTLKGRSAGRGPHHLQQQERPAEGVVGVKVRDHDDVQVGRRDPAPAQVRQGRRRRLDQHVAVQHEAVPVPPGRQEVAGAEEGRGRHLMPPDVA